MSTARDTALTAGLAVSLGVVLALVVDLSSPHLSGGHPATTAREQAPATNLASRMEAQIAAGAPGVALALEQSAPASEREAPMVGAARARAQFELGDAPLALQTVKTGLRICAASGSCSYGELACLDRLDMVIGAIVAAGIVDPKKDPAKVDQALQGLLRRAAFVR